MRTAITRQLVPENSAASIPARIEAEPSGSQPAATRGAALLHGHSFGNVAVYAPAAAPAMVEVSESGDAAEQEA